MKYFITEFLLILIACSLKYSFEQEEVYYYTIDEVYSEHFSLYRLEEADYKEIIQSLSKIFLNSYAFNEISKSPPQPYFDNNYYKIVNIQEKLESIDCSIPELNMYEFYLKIMEILSDLKDMHIKISFKENNFDKFALVNPFNYVFELDENGETKIYFDGCIDLDLIPDINKLENNQEIRAFCEEHSDYIDYPIRIKSINNLDPFDYLLNFGKIASTKNLHGTFSYLMQDTNYLTLDMIAFNFTDENMKQLTIEFDDDETNPTIIKTKYIIESDINIYEEEQPTNGNNQMSNIYANLLGYINNDRNKNKFSFEINRTKNKNKLKAKIGEYQVAWNYRYDDGDEDLFRCYVDSDKKVNVYYVHSFEALNVPKYIETIKQCVEIFDENTYPIIVINDLNNGGVVVLAQVFLGVLSPLMPINKFKGRFRITDNFINNEEISEYIETNFTNIYNCERATYDYLIKGEKSTNYSSNEKLSEVFYLTNSTIQEEIEKIRLTMKNKRKPTEILVLTDGYSFSAASLYIKYLQKQGGAVVVGYFGNIFDESIFDASQSPSPIFTHNIIKMFNLEDIEILEQYGIEVEFPGIQSFYDLNDTNVPLEYEVNPIDDRLDFYLSYNGNDDNYLTIVEKSMLLLSQLDSKCYKNNKKIVKISKDCDELFGNIYTHGGYICSEEGVWTYECEPTYCDMGYILDEKEKICIKDICSSIQEDEKEEEENIEEEEENEGNKEKEKENIEEEEENKEKENYNEEEKEEKEKETQKREDETKDGIKAYVIVIIVIGVIVALVAIFLVIHFCRKKHSSNEIDVDKGLSKMEAQGSSELLA